MKLYGNKKKKSSVNRVLVIFALLLILVAGGTLALYTFVIPPKVPSIGGDDTASYPPEYHPDDAQLGNLEIAPEGVTNADRKKNFYTFLIVGLDHGTNTDTIMVASYDAVNKQANIIGIPRDSLVNVKRKVKKINGAYGSGTLNGGGKEGGINQLKREIKTVIGFVPDFYMVIDINAFVAIVDAVGGVEVEVKKTMKYYDPTENLRIDFEKGTQVLNGADALKFARYRKGTSSKNTISDYERIENQQAVVKGLMTEIIKPTNLLKIPEYIKIFTDNVFTDLSLTDLTWFAGRIKDITDADALSTHTMPTTGTSGLPMYYEYLDKDKIVELVNNTINPYTVEIKGSDLDILSSSP